MEFLFRLEANPTVGRGHATRCFRLAQELISHGYHVVLLTTDLDLLFFKDWVELAQCSRNLEIKELKTKANPNSELSSIQQILTLGKFSWCIIDNYDYSIQHLQNLQYLTDRLGSKLMVFCDEEPWETPGDLVLNQNPTDTPGKFILNNKKIILYGQQFFLHSRWLEKLRQQKLAGSSQSITNQRQILVSLGGADLQNLGLKISIGIIERTGEQILVNYACTSDRAGFETAKQIAAKYAKRLNIYHHQNLDQMVGRCDVAICAGGVTALEMCSLGLFVNVLIIAENQRRGAMNLKKQRLALVYEDTDALIQTVSQQLNNDKWQKLLNGQEQNYEMDGPAKVVEVLMSFDDQI